MKRHRILICLIIAICLPTYSELVAKELPKVIILPFKNITKNPNYDYLETTITDAIRTKLKKKFIFQEASEGQWKAVSKRSFLTDSDCYTTSYGMQLGLYAAQDVVINGGFISMQGAKGSEFASTVVRIISITEKKVISEIAIEIPTDSQIFKTIDEVADKVAKEASKVLPNKDDLKQFNLAEEAMGLNEISVFAGANIIAVPAAFNGDFSSTTNLFPKDFKNAFEGRISYTRHDFLKPHALLTVVGGGHFGTGELKIAVDTKTIHASLAGFFLSGNAGYRFDVSKFFLEPIAGAGFYLGNIKLDYSTLSVLPVDSNGASKSSANLNISSVFVEAGLHLGYQINRVLAVQLTGQYRQYFYIGATSGAGFVGGGLSFRM